MTAGRSSLSRRAGLLLLLASSVPAQIFTADAGVASPELPSARLLATTLHTSRVDDVRLDADVSYSPRTDLELRLRAPLLWRDIDYLDPDGGGRVDGSLSGLGDVNLRAKYALVRADDVMRSDRLSLLADVTFPTADHDAEVDGMVLPRRLQLGHGSFGFGIGPTCTLVRDRHRASAELGYRFWTTHHGHEPGDELYGNLAYWFRLAPVRFEPQEERAEYRLVGEVLSRYRSSDEQDSVGLRDGGTEITGVLGLQVNVSSSQRVELGAILPLYDDTDSVLGARGLGLALSFRMFF
jgi:hypothetical protein